jgi:hypothetical protein
MAYYFEDHSQEKRLKGRKDFGKVAQEKVQGEVGGALATAFLHK